MIYLFTGDNAEKKVQAFEKFVLSASKGVDVFNINKNDFDEMQVESLYSGSGLFFQKTITIFSDVLDREGVRDFVFKKMSLMQDSQNDFIFLEGPLPKSILKEFEKVKTKVNVFELPKIKKEKFNNFLLANAFGFRDKLNLWIHYRQAVDLGVGLEELVGVLFWKIKDMILKKNFVKFKEDELKKIAGKLSYLLPEARSEGKDAEIAFEIFLLESV